MTGFVLQYFPLCVCLEFCQCIFELDIWVAKTELEIVCNSLHLSSANMLAVEGSAPILCISCGSLF